MTNENQQLTVLNKLKEQLFNKEVDDETQQIRVLCQIMREVGGYNVLVEMTPAAIREVYEFLKWESKEMEKRTKKK